MHNIAGKSPLISCFEHDNCNYDSMCVLLKEGWDPNQLLGENNIQYKDKRRLIFVKYIIFSLKNLRSVMYFATQANDEDCIDVLLEYGARVNEDPFKCINMAILKSNFYIFEALLDHGADIHEMCPDIGCFPATFIRKAKKNYFYIIISN